MADPTKYTPAYSYSGWQATNPSRPLPADEVDNDFANIQRTTNELVDALKDVRRSDGKLKNQSVGPDQLSPALTIGFTFTGTWVDGRSYSAGDGVVKDDTFYSARVAHTADVANAPGNAAYWNELFSLNDIVVTGGMSLPRDSFVGDGVTKDFTLSFTPLSKFNLFVQVGGVVQGTDAYSSNGNTLSFISPPPNGYGIEVRGFATVSTLVTPEDGSVSTAKLADQAVTDAKLSTSLQSRIPALMASTMLVDNGDGTAREPKSFSDVRGLLGFGTELADAGKVLEVNTAGDGYELKPAGELTAAANHTNASSRELRARFGDVPVLLDWSGGDDQDRLVNALAASPGNLVIPAVDPDSPYEVEDTVIIPPGTVLVGQGMRDVWEGNAEKASVFLAVGAGTARRWTDIDGADAADDTPMFVAGGNGVRFKGIAIETNSDTPWSAGLFFPCVKRCGYDDNVSVDGPWTDAAVYLDMTWSDRNATLKALHPTVQPSTGMTEFRGGDAYLRGVRALKVQGTTRDPSAADPNTWAWGWGGISDTIFNGGQYRPLGASASRACIWMDAALPGSTALAASGVTFYRPALRTGISQYMAYFDRFSRVEFFGGYGEAPSGEVAQWRLHSARTTEVSVWGGRYVRAPIYVDGVDSGQTMENGQGNHPSFYNRPWNGKAFFPGRVEDGGTIRPATASSGSLGTSSFPYAAANIDQIRLGDNTKPRVTTATGNPEGVVAAPVGSVCFSSNGTWYRKSTGGTGNTGWVVGNV
ncbi:hypothetical protein [Sinorhizobium meliloti]|uniref:hypothetical protein n=1 Tax=Rhizobium meliloti TaxID=382 RepID=UPI000FDB6E2D|nr:hypothetical protein [Sinorhizobium meliloti]RVN54336.1 hypothetical protein CN108_18275 [Sinorhizobium meliloti]